MLKVVENCQLKPQPFSADLYWGVLKGESMKAEFVDVVRTANREFRELIEELSRNEMQFMRSRGAVRRLEKVSIRLSQVESYLTQRPKSSGRAAESEYEILKYRENLKALKTAFETLQYSLLVEKSRLDNARSNLQAAHAWADSVRQLS
jgi:hypothetical protein